MTKVTEEQKLFIKNNPQKDNKELGELLGVHRTTIAKWKKRLGVPGFYELHDFHKYDEYIINSYQIKTSTELAKEIGCSDSYIGKVWRENGCKGKTTRRYYCDFNYFEAIDAPEKAYLLGVICSDGNVYKRDGHEEQWAISVAIKDKDWIEAIAEEIKSNNPVRITEKTATITIVSQKMCDNLRALGIVERKTYEMDLEKVINNIPFEFQMDFFHGYFDGDGSISSQPSISRTNITFAVPERFKDAFISHLSEHGIEARYVKDARAHKYTIPFGTINITGTLNKYCLSQLFLYHNTLSLKRKTEKLAELIDKVSSNITNRSENKIAVLKWEELLGSLRR